MELNAYRLTKWRRIAIIREGDKKVGRPLCQLCGHAFSTFAVQAHHVYPKALYPEKAYDLDNAAILCTSCHYDVVHMGNATIDLNKLSHWKEFVVFFKRQNKLSYRKHFNEENQYRI